MSTLKNTLRLLSSTRSFSRSAVKNQEVNDAFKEFKRLQAHFQKDDGLPVHLKGGVGDKILLGITSALCVIGLAMSAELFYTLSFPPKQN